MACVRALLPQLHHAARTTTLLPHPSLRGSSPALDLPPWSAAFTHLRPVPLDLLRTYVTSSCSSLPAPLSWLL